MCIRTHIRLKEIQTETDHFGENPNKEVWFASQKNPTESRVSPVQHIGRYILLRKYLTKLHSRIFYLDKILELTLVHTAGAMNT